MRTNTITRIFSEKNPKISLEKNSYYYISFYEDILKLMLTNASGIWTICSHKRINIDELSRIANNTPKWGSFRYTPLIDDDKSNFYHFNNFSLDCSHKRLKNFFLITKTKAQSYGCSIIREKLIEILRSKTKFQSLSPRNCRCHQSPNLQIENEGAGLKDQTLAYHRHQNHYPKYLVLQKLSDILFN